MKSAIGIGSLLMDGLGDTIRVSLTEDPELEINPCRCPACLKTEGAHARQLSTVVAVQARGDHSHSGVARTRLQHAACHEQGVL